MKTILIYGKVGRQSSQDRYRTIYKEELIRKVQIHKSARVDSVWMNQIEPRASRMEVVQTY